MLHVHLLIRTCTSKTRMCTSSILQAEGVAAIIEHFPFHDFFSNAPQPVFKGQSFAEDMDIAEVSTAVYLCMYECVSLQHTNCGHSTLHLLTRLLSHTDTL